MTTKTIDRLDTIASTILLIWVGMAICVSVFTIPLILKYTINYELSELLISKIATRLDVAAWFAFGVSFLLVKGARFIMGIAETEVISYMRLWSAAAFLALLVCFTSTFIVAPKLCAVRSHVGIAMEVGGSVATYNDGASFHREAFKISRQLTWLRLLLAVGLVAGVKKLPRQD